MRKIFLSISLFLFLGSLLSAGVVKKTKTEISFKGFGKFTVLGEEKVVAERSLNNTKTDFKGQGLVGGLAAKTILRSGDFGQIIDLPSRIIYQLDHKKKEYTTSPIEALKEQEMGGAKEEKEQEAETRESKIKITRSEFKVEPTTQEKVINQFPCRQYLITWLVEWENIETGAKGKELLSSEVWTTPFTGVLKDSQAEETQFANNYLKALGLERRTKEKEILGETWLNLLGQLNPGEERPKLETKAVANQMKKIEGYPVLVSGKYFSSQEGGEAEEEKPSGGARSLVGGLAKSVLKKKPKAAEAEEPALTYYFEVIGLETASLGEADFQVPAGYKKKG
jgi:hypothetical protein